MPALEEYVRPYLAQRVGRCSRARLVADHGPDPARSGDRLVLQLGRLPGPPARPQQWYDKRRLVPFGEFFPVPQAVRDWLRLMNLPYSDFQPGSEQQSPLRAGARTPGADGLLRGRVRFRAAAARARVVAARQRHQRRVVRRFDRAAPAPRHQPHALARKRSRDAARDQRRRHRADRPRRLGQGHAAAVPAGGARQARCSRAPGSRRTCASATCPWSCCSSPCLRCVARAAATRAAGQGTHDRALAARSRARANCIRRHDAASITSSSSRRRRATPCRSATGSSGHAFRCRWSSTTSTSGCSRTTTAGCWSTRAWPRTSAARRGCTLEPGELQGRPLRRVFVTHDHPDHMGLARWLHERHGAPVWMSPIGHASTAEFLGDAGRARSTPGASRSSRAHGMDVSPEAHALGAAAASTAAGTAACRRWAARSRAATASRPAGARGRSSRPAATAAATCACTTRPTSVLISGDQVLPTISPNVSVLASRPDANPLAEFLESLARLRALRARHARAAVARPPVPRPAPAHRGAALASPAAAGGAARRPAASRPRPTRCSPVMYGRPLRGFHRFLAVGETVAHLNHLWHAGREVERRTSGPEQGSHHGSPRPA